MAIELLSQIKQAEEKADMIRREAAEQARDIIKAMEESVLEDMRRGTAQARNAYAKALDEHEAAVQAALTAQAADRQKQREALKEAALAKAPQAADFIAERIMQHGDH